MKLRDLFESDVTRDIPPVVYFHEQSPQKLADEVKEYIITGGYPEGHPHKKRVPNGIHEQYVRLLRAMVAELQKPGGPELPASWISGFYGSGKSSFAKLLGLALDGVALPDGRSLAEVWISRNTSPLAAEMREAYAALRKQVDPISVVFDIGGVARDDEQIHSAVVRQVQRRLGYCPDPYVAEMELRLERDGQWQAFEKAAQKALGRPWSEAKHDALADDQFSQVMHALFPERFIDPMAWILARAGSTSTGSSAEEATRAISDMLKYRTDGKKTLFIVVDEVSQYVHQDPGRMLKLQSFVASLGSALKGKAWLLVTGQEKLEEGGNQNILSKMKDRFPEKLRVHLAGTNIRDVVHKRLLTKKPAVVETLHELFRKHRNDLQLFAYQCEDITADDFVEVYPLLPQHIELILQLTSALRSRSSRSQGDDQGVRGLLQLLGELFRAQKLADAPLGSLVTFDQVYDIQHTALDSDVQASMARVLNFCAQRGPTLAARAAKVVALLELIQDTVPTDAKFVASCLYDRLDRGSHQEQVTEALELLRRENLLGYSEKSGYKLQSSAGEAWERRRRDVNVPWEQLSEVIQGVLGSLVKDADGASMKGYKFPWRATFSDGRGADNTSLSSSRENACIKLDLRLLNGGEGEASLWINRSSESSFSDCLLWVVEDKGAELESAAREYKQSYEMVHQHRSRKESLTRDQQRLLFDEEGRLDELTKRLRRTVDAAFANGEFYFRGKRTSGRELGANFSQALRTLSERILPELFHAFVSSRVTDADLMQLLEESLSAPSPVFVKELGILSLDAGKYVPSCDGVVPSGIAEFIRAENGASGARLLERFGSPPFGYAPEIVRACLAGLLRDRRVRIQPESGHELTSVRDAGVRDIFDKDRAFKRASFFPAGGDPTGPKMRARICKCFAQHLGLQIDREDEAIADVVATVFPQRAELLREVYRRYGKLPTRTSIPYALAQLDDALTSCVRLARYTLPTVRECDKQLDALNDGLSLLAVVSAELTDEAIDAVRRAYDVAQYQGAQLEELGELDEAGQRALKTLREHLGSAQPWRDILALEEPLALLRETYRERRQHLLTAQGDAAEVARTQLRSRQDFFRLSADKAHHVERPLNDVLLGADVEALQPSLVSLRDGFPAKLARALEEANSLLDQVLSEGNEPVFRKLKINLQNREIKNAEELEQVLAELRTRVLEQLEAGARVRLI